MDGGHPVGEVVDGYRWDGTEWTPVAGLTVDGYQWNGSEWVPVAGVVVDGYRWDGTQWMPVAGAIVDGFRWDGTRWAPVTPRAPVAPAPGVRPLVRRRGFWVAAVVALLLLIWAAWGDQPQTGAPADDTEWSSTPPPRSSATPDGSVLNGPGALLVDPASGDLFVANMTEDVGGSYSIAVFGPGMESFVGWIPLEYSQPLALALDARTNTLYVGHMGESQGVLVMDASTHEVRADALARLQCGPIAVDPSQHTLFCASGHTVYFADTRTLKVTRKIELEVDSGAITVDAELHRLYVGNYDQRSGFEIVVLDTRTGRRVGSIPTTGVIAALAVDGDHRICVAFDVSGSPIQLLDPEKAKVVEELPSDDFVSGLAVDTERDVLYASSYFSNSIGVYSLS